jgi:phage I-like protein
MANDPPADPNPGQNEHARELLALIGQYTAEVTAFSQSLGAAADAEDEAGLQARQARMDELRARIAALRAKALPKRPEG